MRRGKSRGERKGQEKRGAERRTMENLGGDGVMERDGERYAMARKLFGRATRAGTAHVFFAPPLSFERLAPTATLLSYQSNQGETTQ